MCVLAPTADKHQHSVLLSCTPTITAPPVESITQGMGVLCSPRPSNTTNNTTNGNSNSTSLVIYEHGQNEKLPSPDEQVWMEKQIDKVLYFPPAGSHTYGVLRAEGDRAGQQRRQRELARTMSNGFTTTETNRSPRPDIDPVPLQRQRSAPAGSHTYGVLRAEGDRAGQQRRQRELARTMSNGFTTTETNRSPRPDIDPVPLQRQRSAPAGMCDLCSCVVA